jgi:hypothetical protein
MGAHAPITTIKVFAAFCPVGRSQANAGSRPPDRVRLNGQPHKSRGPAQWPGAASQFISRFARTSPSSSVLAASLAAAPAFAKCERPGWKSHRLFTFPKTGLAPQITNGAGPAARYGVTIATGHESP